MSLYSKGGHKYATRRKNFYIAILDCLTVTLQLGESSVDVAVVCFVTACGSHLRIKKNIYRGIIYYLGYDAAGVMLFFHCFLWIQWDYWSLAKGRALILELGSQRAVLLF